MLGFGKWFVIFLFLSLIIWYGTGNVTIALQVMLTYAVLKVLWKFFTDQ